MSEGDLLHVGENHDKANQITQLMMCDWQRKVMDDLHFLIEWADASTVNLVP